MWQLMHRIDVLMRHWKFLNISILRILGSCFANQESFDDTVVECSAVLEVVTDNMSPLLARANQNDQLHI